MMALFLVIQVPTGYATSLSDLKQEKSQNEQDMKQLNKSIDQKSNEIKTIENTQDKLLGQIQKLNKDINITNEAIDTVNAEINAANREISELVVVIEELELKIQQRDELLTERARAIQAGGSVSYLDVLLGANSFIDFIDRFSAVNTLMDADRQIMRDQKNDKEALEEQKLILENKKRKLEENHAELARLKESLDLQKKEMNKLIDELEAEQNKLRNQKNLLEEEYSEALEINDTLQKQINKEQARIAEIARQEALRKQREQAANGGGNSGNTPSVAAGTWTKPANGRLTSPFGWRNIGSGNEFHYGIDIANSSGTPIVSAGDGVVSYASALSTYGNVIMVTHSIDGQIWTTVYAHLSGYSVGVGDVVSKGQKIGSMGNTGRSTGPHLHFEIHNGSWNGKRTNALNPLRYISI